MISVLLNALSNPISTMTHGCVSLFIPSIAWLQLSACSCRRICTKPTPHIAFQISSYAFTSPPKVLVSPRCHLVPCDKSCLGGG
ncbi:uncharacterized protein EURHEDRAFT_351908 [Aspergillus ruber CBS 135680]|uniref:Uncharacterized protein n=1 Tax=Aspergillus ruber (strain CBS 135680) TaxID=1388766 RepID=A0A017SI36_ASPRC|nr:uncharacterized protein EURHEDRAFT_351908 [Aspergillus ruber CBS 135680]EYE96421.1 hypothetical protein EURHEDRAFT_351908 [Aspergillus ruber CBS 135680]